MTLAILTPSWREGLLLGYSDFQVYQITPAAMWGHHPRRDRLLDLMKLAIIRALMHLFI
ncbi:hypothetical protein [Sodalis sp.]|uniref:hypothetical protein n=1 Tax=Sodalis sp. (in: enterobacteria) TaxID=1898979 RepID=UPI003872B2E9